MTPKHVVKSRDRADEPSAHDRESLGHQRQGIGKGGAGGTNAAARAERYCEPHE
jgi:hypothetical protein